MTLAPSRRSLLFWCLEGKVKPLGGLVGGFSPDDQVDHPSKMYPLASDLLKYVRFTEWKTTQGIVGCTPIPTYPYGKSLYKRVFMPYNFPKNPKVEHNKHHGSTRTLGVHPSLSLEPSGMDFPEVSCSPSNMAL